MTSNDVMIECVNELRQLVGEVRNINVRLESATVLFVFLFVALTLAILFIPIIHDCRKERHLYRNARDFLKH